MNKKTNILFTVEFNSTENKIKLWIIDGGRKIILSKVAQA